MLLKVTVKRTRDNCFPGAAEQGLATVQSGGRRQKTAKHKILISASNFAHCFEPSRGTFSKL